VVHAGEAQLFEWQMPQLLDRLVDVDPAVLNLLQ